MNFFCGHPVHITYTYYYLATGPESQLTKLTVGLPAPAPPLPSLFPPLRVTQNSQQK